MKQIAFFFVLAVMLLIGGAPVRADNSLSPFKAVPEIAVPDYSFTSGSDGKVLSLKDKSGKYLLLHFWATWCAPCLDELPGLARLEEEFPSEIFEVIAVPTNLRDAAAVEKFYNEKNIVGPSVHLDHEKKAMTVFSLNSLPVSILVSPGGKIVGRIDAPVQWEDEDVKVFFRLLLAPDLQ